MYGNLLCISLDGSFEEPVWAVVERHIASERFVTKRLRMFFEISVFSNPWSNLRENWFYNKVRTYSNNNNNTRKQNYRINEKGTIKSIPTLLVEVLSGIVFSLCEVVRAAGVRVQKTSYMLRDHTGKIIVLAKVRIESQKDSTVWKVHEMIIHRISTIFHKPNCISCCGDSWDRIFFRLSSPRDL